MAAKTLHFGEVLKLEPSPKGMVARGAGREVTFEPDAVTYRLGGAQLRLRASYANERDDHAQVVPRQSGDDMVIYDRPSYEERFSVHGLEVEQSWAFARAPVRSGAFAVRVPVEGLTYVGSGSEGLRFSGSDASVLYSHATFRDATGRTSAIPAIYAAGEIVLELSEQLIASSRFPAVLDPTISSVLHAWGVPSVGPATAYSALHDEFLVTFLERTSDPSAEKHYVRAARLRADGTVLDRDAVTIVTRAAERRSLSTVAPAAGLSGWYVHWEELTPLSGSSAYKTVEIKSVTAQSPLYALSPLSGVQLWAPFVIAPNGWVVGQAAQDGAYLLMHGSEVLDSTTSPVLALAADDGLIAWQRPDGIAMVRSVSGVSAIGSAAQRRSFSLAAGGGVHLLSWVRAGVVQGYRLDSNGMMLGSPAPPLTLDSDDGPHTSAVAVFDGESFVVVSATSSGVYATRFATTGERIDPRHATVATHAMNARIGLAAASDGKGHLLVAYTLKGSPNLIEAKLIDMKAGGETQAGQPCSDGFACASGWCVDGVCCETACGYGTEGDCQACSVGHGAARDGECAVLDSGRVCRDWGSSCDVVEVCDGLSKACPADVVRPSGYVCGPVAAGICDLDDLCDGSSPQCRSDLRKPTTELCREARDVCDAPEFCNGVSVDCAPDMLRGTEEVCRQAAGECDQAETCTGAADGCPPDLKLDAATPCRGLHGVCDLVELCDGASDTCPADTAAPAGVGCRDALGECDVAEACDGVAFDCPRDVFDQGTICREAQSVCDSSEVCTGESRDCPPDVVAGHDVVCRPAAGPCDVQELCTGKGLACPADEMAGSEVVCRDAAGGCDVAEHCEGTAACPSDAFMSKGALCRLPNDICDPAEICDGESAQCPPDIACSGVDEEPEPAVMFPEGLAPPDVDAPRAPRASSGCSVAPAEPRTRALAWLYGLGIGLLLVRRVSSAQSKASRARHVLMALVAAGCGDSSQGPLAMQVQSRAAEGAKCRASDDCWENLYCDESDSTCRTYGVRGSLCWKGNCMDPADFCDDGTGRCHPKAVADETCDARTPCAQALECRDGRCLPVDGLHQACRSDGTCASGLACVLDTCVQPGAEGEPCLPGRMCNNALSCIAERCQAIGAASGQPCFADGTCAPDLGCSERGQCERIGALEGPCTAKHTCDAPLYCDVNFCRAPLELGKTCTADNACQSGACRVPLAHADAGGPRTCVRANDPIPGSQQADPTAYCAVAGFAEEDPDRLCNHARCQLECQSCYTSWRNTIAAIAVCDLAD